VCDVGNCGIVCAVAVRRIARSRMRIVRELGEGAFGRVYLGTCDLAALTDDDFKPSLAPDSTSAVIEVAIKTLKEGSHGCGMGGVEGGAEEEPTDQSAEREFQREAELLAGLCHDNIVRFHGICDDTELRMLLLEYMPQGDLNKYLRYAARMGLRPTFSRPRPVIFEAKAKATETIFVPELSLKLRTVFKDFIPGMLPCS